MVEGRESPLSVGRKWLPWCLGLIFLLTIGWTALIAWVEVSSGKHEGILETAAAVGSNTAPAAPLIVLYAIMAVTVFDLLGGMVMVTARYLTNKFVKPLIEEHEARGRGRREAQVDRMEHPPPRSGEEWTSLSTSRRPHRRKPTVSTRDQADGVHAPSEPQ